MSDPQSGPPGFSFNRTLVGVSAGLAGLMAALGVTGALGIGGVLQTVIAAACAGFMIGRLLRAPIRRPSGQCCETSPLRALYLAHRARRPGSDSR